MNIRSSSQRFFSSVAAIAIFTGCSRNRMPEPVSKPGASRETVEASTQDSWLPTQVAGTIRYLIQDTASISISGDSTHTVPIQSSTLYSITLTSSNDSFVLTGRTESRSTNAHEHTSKSVADTATLLEFHAAVSRSGRVASLAGNNASTCGEGVDPVVTRIFELAVFYPARRLKVGDRWADTISVTTCRGKTSLVQKTIRQYELVQFETWRGHDTAKIQRSSSSVFTGASIDSKNHLSTSGSGSSETTIHTDRFTGSLLESDSQSHSMLSISTTRGTYPFSQTIATHVEAQ